LQLEQYTADAICQAMGLVRFVDPGWADPTIRILLMPSFHPEVCITWSRPQRCEISVVALTEHLWEKPFPVRIPDVRETVYGPKEDFDDLRSAFVSASAKPRGGACIDGMGGEFCLAEGGRILRFKEHVYRSEITAMVAMMIHVSWESCRDPRIRNAIGLCAQYVDVMYPSEEAPPSPRTANIMVLGTPEARESYFSILRAKLKSGPSQE
jgi:hypothetical protein